jgi:MFS family permease
MARPDRAPSAPPADLGAAFRRLWLGQGIAQLGAQISLVAIPLTAVVWLHATALQMGILGAAATLPVLLVALPVGVLADRGDPRPLCIAADAGRALLAVSVVVLAVGHELTLGLLVGAAAVAGALTAAFDIGYQSLMPRLVEPELLAAGNARLEATRAAGQMAGPGLGGALVQTLSGPIAVGATALTYAVSVAALLGVRPPAARPAAASGPSRGALAQMRDGLTWLAAVPALRAIAGCTATANLCGTMTAAVYVLFAVHDGGLTPLLLGLVSAGQSAGGLLGASLAPALAARLGTVGLLRAAALGFSLAPLAVPLAPPHPAAAMAVLMGAGAAQALARAAYTVTQVSLRQSLAPKELLGRVNATMRLLSWIGLPFGFFAGGLVAARVGVVDTLWLAAAGGLLALPWLTSRTLAERPPNAPAPC